MNLISKVKILFLKLDWIIIIAILFLSFFSLLVIYNMSLSRENFSIYFEKQILFFIVGFFLMFLFAFFDYHIFRNSSKMILLLYFFMILSLVGLFIFGFRARGTAGWFIIGSFKIQPVEFVKIIAIILFAKYFSLKHTEIARFRHIIISGIYIGLPMTLVFLQPDFGSAIILFLIWIIIMMISGIKIRHLFLIGFFSLVSMLFGWFYILKDYQKNRIITFLNPLTDPAGSGYNVIQSMIAIGSGRFFGKGLGFATQTQLGFLPEAHTDFIFASIAETFGFFGVLILLFLYVLILGRILVVINNSRNNFSKIFCAGLMIIMIIHIFINIGMNLGLFPVVGISLPFLSYGGSSIIALFIGFGILQSIKVRS